MNRPLSAAIAALLLVAAPLSGCGDDGGEGGAATTAPPTTAAPQVPPQPEVFGFGVGKQSLLGAPKATLVKLIGKPTQARGLLVTSVTDRGFFAGSNAADRVYIHWSGKSYKPAPNTRADFEGQVRRAPSAPGKALGLTARNDLATLKAQGIYVRATDVRPTPAG